MHLHRHLGRKKFLRSVDMRSKRRSILSDLPQITKAKHLKSAAVREDRTVPMHKAMQAPRFPHQFHARTKKEVIGVAENDPCAKITQLIRRDSLNRRLRTYWHKDRCREAPMRRVNYTCTRTRCLISAKQFIGNRGQSYTTILKTPCIISQTAKIFKTQKLASALAFFTQYTPHQGHIRPYIRP